MLAQPSAVVEYGDRGQTTDVATFMDPAKLNDEFSASFGTELVSGEGGKIWGVPYKVDVKSTIWYPIKAFEAAGYAVPTTWDELKALSAKIVADGNGSPVVPRHPRRGRDRLDRYRLARGRHASNGRASTPTTSGSPTSSSSTHPRSARPSTCSPEQWFTDGYVNGGFEAITATDRLESWDPMFAPDNNWDGFTPGCWMHRQATWFGPDFFPDKRAAQRPVYESQYVLGEDIGIMYFPPIDPAQGTPGLGAGDTLMVLADDAEATRDPGRRPSSCRRRTASSAWIEHRQRASPRTRPLPGVVPGSLQAAGRSRHRGQRHELRLRRIGPDATGGQPSLLGWDRAPGSTAAAPTPTRSSRASTQLGRSNRDLVP